MKDMRLGRSLGSTLPGCEGLLSEAVLITDSSAGWAGNSFICSGSRRTRLANGAIVGVSRVVAAGGGRRQKAKECTKWTNIIFSSDSDKQRRTLLVALIMLLHRYKM